jgi:hypothetical protein
MGGPSQGCGRGRRTQRHDHYRGSLTSLPAHRRGISLLAGAFEAHGLAGLRATRIQQYDGSRRPRGPRSQRCGHRGFERPASTALTVLSSLPAGPNLASSLTVFAKISSSRLITRSGWHTCITEQPHRPTRNQLPIEFVTICRRPKSIFSRSDDA